MPPYRIFYCLPLAILPIALLFVGPAGILAQSTTANCLSSFYWMYNTKDQSPCLVASYLISECLGDFTIYALSPGYYYSGPSQAQQNSCTCSSVTYIADSACGLCQNHTMTSWSAWTANCTTAYPGVYPPGTPNGTAVPQWMYQDVTQSNWFNVVLAQSVGGSPESAATQPLSTSLPSIASTLGLPSLTALPSESSPASSGSPPNTGVIAGSVVGGVIAGALIGGGIVFILKKRPWQPAVFTDPTEFDL